MPFRPIFPDCRLYFSFRNGIFDLKHTMHKRFLFRIPTLSLLAAVLFMTASFKGDEVISGELAFLIGDYDFICSFQDGVRSDKQTLPDTYSLRITKKSELFVYKNNKKLEKYHFSDIELPVLDEHDYVMFYKKDQYYPLFYKGDTVVMHISPREFNDNYFVKRKK